MNLVASDPELIKVIAALNKRRALPVQDLIKEAILYLNKAVAPGRDVSKVADRRQVLAAYRTKVVYIKVRLSAERDHLTGIRDDMRDFLQTKYMNFLGSLKNEQSRRSILAQALSPLRKRIRRMNDALDIVETILKDYDARAYCFRDVIDSLKLGERE